MRDLLFDGTKDYTINIMMMPFINRGVTRSGLAATELMILSDADAIKT